MRPGAPFCTLCYADLRPEPVPVASPASVALDPLTAPLHALAGAHGSAPTTARSADPVASDAAWPCANCGVLTPLAEPSCRACGSGFLAAVRDGEPPLLALPVVGDVSRLSRMQGVGLAVGVVAALLLVLVVLGLLTS